MLHALLISALAAEPPAAALVHFENRVRPLLAERCGACHGAKKQENGLRLDTAEGVRKGGANGPVLNAGAVRESALLQHVKGAGDFARMPPEGPPLTAPQIADLEQWLAAGAPFPAAVAAKPAAAAPHWSLQPIADPKPPAVRDAAWPRNDLDRFVKAPQEAAGLSPAPDADRGTLLRRASFGLTGLPPSPAELAAFAVDPAPTPAAFAKQVERLLAAPHYGEHWGRHWLDVARYADTKGYVFTEDRRYPFAYAYRDWVVEALNRDLPYDRFVKLQLAADRLVPADDNRDLAALGFLTVGRRFLNDAQEIADDRIDVTTRGLMGLGVQCARCHDHKFDPIPTADYYSLWGVFMSSEEPKEGPLLGPRGGTPASRDYDAQRGQREQALTKVREAARGTAQQRLRQQAPALLKLAAETEFRGDHPQLVALAKQRDLPPRMYRKWLEHWQAATGPKAPAAPPGSALAAFRDLLSAKPADYAAQLAKLKTGNHDQQWLAAAFQAPPANRPALAETLGGLIAKAAADPASAPRLAAWLGDDGPFAVRPADTDVFLNVKERIAVTEAGRSLAKLDAEHPGAPKRAMAMVDRAQPVQPHVFVRGNPGRPGPAVPRQFLACLSGPDRKPFATGSGRLELAEAIAHAKNPLTARVFVNRVWGWHFGQPLVATPSDFGLRGEPPSHPELLDWLATKFIRSGWSLKELHRLILASHAYAQGAVPAERGKDPGNRLLTHFPRRRLAWEELRDSLLAVSGELDRTVGGRSAPLFGDAAGERRRTLYGFIDRQDLDPAYRTFDFASPEATSARRFDTVAPQQGLFLLNHPFVRARAAAAAQAPEIAALPAAEKTAALTWRVLGRAATADELRLGAAFHAADPQTPEAERWTRFAHALLQANEFAFVD